MVATRKDSPQSPVQTLKLTITAESDLDCFYGKAMGFHRDLFPTTAPLLPTDVNKLVKILGELGVQRVLIGGAEPLLRKDAPGFVKSASAHRNIREVRLVTNGTNLKSFADPLRKMGLKKIDLIHLDTFHFMKYQRITGKDCLYRVLDGIEKVEKLKYQEICLNIQLLNEINNDEIVEMARTTKTRKLHIRFVEYYPRFKNYDPYSSRSILTANEAKKMIENYQGLEPVFELDQEGDYQAFKFPSGIGKISFVTRQDQETEDALPCVHMNPEGNLFHSFAPNRHLPVLEHLRKDSKDPKLKKSIEKLLATTPDQADKKPLAQMPPKPLAGKRKPAEVTTRV